jgi:hypothetical protein
MGGHSITRRLTADDRERRHRSKGRGPVVVAQYHFLSEFTVDGDAEHIWSALIDVPTWPSWWSWLKRVDVLRAAATADGVGGIYRNVVRAPAGYGFTYDTEITAVEHLRGIDLDSRGDLVGRGRFGMRPLPDGTIYLAFAWLVGTPKPWMSALAPIGRPMFSWNHDHMMSAFGSGLARVAGGDLRSTRNTTIPPNAPGFQVMPDFD